MSSAPFSLGSASRRHRDHSRLSDEDHLFGDLPLQLREVNDSLPSDDHKPAPNGPRLRTPNGASQSRRSTSFPEHTNVLHTEDEYTNFRDRFMRKGKRRIGVRQSLKNLATASWLNVFIFVIPFAWGAFLAEANKRLTFALCFIAVLPLARMFEYGAEEMTWYLGHDLGDLVVVTLANLVEAILAIVLLQHCELKLLKSTIVGVVILRLLFVPGISFIVGGAGVAQQELNPDLTQINQSLLTLGALCILLPAAFFAASDSTFAPPGQTPESFVTEGAREMFSKMSRGLAVIMLVVYICSRIYLHNPPGGQKFHLSLASREPPHEAHHVHHGPQINQWVCIAMLLVCVGLLAVTAEFLVTSIKFVREDANIEIEWFGLILLPLASYAADGFIITVYWLRQHLRRYIKHTPGPPPSTIAKGISIDLSIQFMLFWTPFLVFLAWAEGKPLVLLFDMFEITILVGACFIVNYVTADAKTNWAEGMMMVAFYVMIALTAWWYKGQPEIEYLSQCAEVKAK